MNTLQEGSGLNTIPLLQIKNLNTKFFTEAGNVHAVNNVNLNVKKNEIFASKRSK